MQLVRKYYSSFVIFKPETSRPANSERYFIAYEFKGINATELKHLHELHAEWHKLDPSGGLNPTKYITDIINHTVSPEFMSEFKVYNQKLSSFQKEKFREIDAAMSMKLDDPVYFEKQEKIAIEWCKKMDIPT